MGEFRGVVRNPAYLQVAEQLREAILDGRLAPGDELPTERDLTTQFSVSRTTVREALRALQAQGLITGRTAPSRPVVSAVPNPLAEAFELTLRFGQASLLDLIQLRGMLELEAIDRAVLDHDPSRWTAAREALARMRSTTGLPDEFHDAYAAFHLALVRVAGNELVNQMLSAALHALHEHLRGAFRQFVEREGTQTIERLVHDHAELLDALEVSDGARARAVIRGHAEHFYTRLLETAPPRFPVGDPIDS